MYKILFNQKYIQDGYKTGKVICCVKTNSLNDFHMGCVKKYGYVVFTHIVGTYLESTAYIDIKIIKGKEYPPLILILYDYIIKMLREEKLERICNG